MKLLHYRAALFIWREIMKRVNIAVGIIFILFSLFIFIQSFLFTQISTGLGPEFFPRIISVIIFALSILLIITSLKNASLSSSFKDIFNEKIHLPLLSMALIILYGFCLFYVGYLFSTMAFCFLFLHLFNIRNMKLKLSISILFPLFLFFIFKKLFLINLPSGFLI